jgi:CubicO group peptidase (beta-lactamase class C family)
MPFFSKIGSLSSVTAARLEPGQQEILETEQLVKRKMVPLSRIYQKQERQKEQMSAMQIQASLRNERFQELNDYVYGVQKLVSASASSVYVIQNGETVNEWYSGFHRLGGQSRSVDERSRFNVASIRKTYLGLAVSLALHEGKIRNIDDEICDYLPDLDEKLMAGTTIRHCLTHTHGLQSPNKRLFPPGSGWKYNNAGVNLLIRIINAVFGKPLAAVLQERLFKPYGLTETGWCKDPKEELVWVDDVYAGEQGGENNLFVSTRELAHWGYLHLTKGKHEGGQPVAAEVFARAAAFATPAMLDETLPRNGFFWHVQDRPRPRSEIGGEVPIGSFQSFGFYGTALLVIPKFDAVAVRMLNQTGPNPPGYDYIRDIQTFGNLVCSCLAMKG